MHVVRPYKDSFYNWKSTQRLGDGYCDYKEIGTLYNGNVHWPVCKSQLFASNLNGTYGKILSYSLDEEKVGEIVFPLDTCLNAKFVGLGEVDG